MTFAESLAEFSAAQIVAALGCPRQTAYAWLDGTRQPPAWQQTLFLAVIAKESKKHNKASHGTPGTSFVNSGGNRSASMSYALR